MHVTAIRATGVHAVVVTFNPAEAELAELLASLVPQVSKIIVVDNGSRHPPLARLPFAHTAAIESISLAENMGIAFAQNTGIARAIELGARFVLLSDQDSRATPTMVAELLAALAGGEGAGTRCAAVGPVTVDTRTRDLSYFWRSGSGKPTRWAPSDAAEASVVDVEFLIASGTLIPVDVLRRIGGMRSSYFIDHVDTEWCFRARAAGYRLLGATHARLEHRIGEGVRSIWFIRRRQVKEHAPVRDYYTYRNTLLMLRDAALPTWWRIHFVWRLVQFACFFSLFASERRTRLRLMALGLLHGVRRRCGRLDPATGALHDIGMTALDPQTVSAHGTRE